MLSNSSKHASNSKRKVNNLLQNKYVTDANIWTVDETFFSQAIVVFIAINIKTQAILGRIMSPKPVQDSHIIELYSIIIEETKQTPIIIHSDLAPEYSTPSIKEFCKNMGIELSLAHGESFQNQVSETINNVFKRLVILVILSKDTLGLHALNKTQPA